MMRLKSLGFWRTQGGITEHLNAIVSFTGKETGATLVSSPEPVDLLDRLEQVYESLLLPKYQNLTAHSDPDGVLQS